MRLDNKARSGRQVWWFRSVGLLALVAMLSLWNLGVQHASEHGPVHESSLCGTCLAVATEGLAPPVGDAIGAGLDAHPTSLKPQPQAVSPHRAFRFSARAPPASLA